MKLPIVVILTGALLLVSEVISNSVVLAQGLDGITSEHSEAEHQDFEETLKMQLYPCGVKGDSCVSDVALIPTVTSLNPEELKPATQLGESLQLSHPDSLLAQDWEGATVKDVKIQFVDVSGNVVEGSRVPEEWIREEIRLQPGDPFSEGAVQADMRQLYQLGLFTYASVNIEEVGDDVIVTYNLQELSSRRVNLETGDDEEVGVFGIGRTAPRSVRFGAGYNDDVGAFITSAYRDITVGALHQRFEADLTASTKGLEYDLRFISPYRVSENTLGYTLRTFRNREISHIFDEDIDLPNDEEAREHEIGGNIWLTRPLGDWDGTLGFNYTRVSIRDENSDLFKEDEEWNPLSWSGTGIDDLYTISLGFTRNWLDDPFDPRAGSVLTVSTEQSIPIGEGEIAMNRLRANYVKYVPTQWLGSNDPYALPEMFAFNVQAGTVIGDLPPHQAFEIGGINSVRGYSTGEVGSGRSYVLASAEYRFPLWRDVGMVFFADFGSDLGSGDTVLGEPAEVRDKPGTGAGIGAGVRVRTFLGLIRVDMGVSDQGDLQVELRTGQRF